jgi:hypothetical protein
MTSTHRPEGPSAQRGPEYHARALTHHLEALYAVHGLNRHELIAVQRGIVKLQRAGVAPSANEFWEMTALPRAQVLTVVATAALDRELAAILPVSPRDPCLTESLAAALAMCDPVDELGRWWQRRLRRAAMLRALPQVMWRAPGQAELTVARIEMELLDRAPWSHGDRLLSAFEVAHADVVAYGRRRITDLAGRLVG